MGNNGWILKPGERLKESGQIEDLINEYIASKRDSRLMVLTEPDNTIVYFVSVDDLGKMKSADIAMLVDNIYWFLPEDMARPLAETYVLHANLISNAFQYLQASCE